jgi:hypothetical protein
MTMDDQQNASNDNGGKGYNIALTPKDGTIDTSPTSTGTKKIKFRATMKLRGQDRERTVVAMGKSAEAIEGMIEAGKEVSLRVLFDRAPSQEEGKKGAEYLTVLGIPLPPKAKAA